MTESMVERVARAMCDRVNGAGDYDENIAQRASGWNGQARAAIEAMREPTEAMRRAGHISGIDWPTGNGGMMSIMGLDNGPSAYRRMITAALSEENPPAAP